MKRNKFIILKILTFMLAFGLIFSSSLAYFTDRAETSAQGTAGSFDIEVFSELSGKDFMIPNKYYALQTFISNLGNKSADVKMIITLESDDNSIFTGDPQIADLYATDEMALSGTGTINGYNYSYKVNTDGSVTYTIESTINGNEEFTETETEEGISTDTFMPEIYLGVGDYFTTNATYITMTVDIYAKQHRNTQSWDLITTYNEVKN